MKPTPYILFAALIAALPAAAQIQYLAPWWIDMGETDSTGLGLSVAPLGDINGDGLNDFVVGCGGAEILYIYLGNTEPDTIPYMMIPRPDSSMKWFGHSVFNVGDANEDGHLDFVAQATLHEGSSPEHTYAYLYFGGPILDSYPDIVFDGGQNLSTKFGHDGRDIGNFFGDSENEFIILDQDYWLGIGLYGRIYVYHGGALLDSIPDLIIDADSTLNHIAYDVAGLGDINDDGFTEFVMSHPQCWGIQGQANAGIIAIYYGGISPAILPSFAIRGTQNQDLLGISITVLDYNCDGQLDLVAGNSRDFSPNHYSSINLYLISDNMSGQADRIFPDNWGEGFSTGDGLVGMDLNGDGWEDIISCNPQDILGTGMVHVYLNGDNEDSLVDAIYLPNSHIGASLGAGGANVGDINGDYLDDLVVGEPGFGDYYEQIHYGRIHLILGDTSFHQSVGVLPRGTPFMPNAGLLLRAYPLPFNSRITFDFDYPVNQNPTLKIYNLGGGFIQEIPLQRGQRKAFWEGLTAGGQSCTSGIYLVQMKTSTSRITKKILLIR